MTRYKTVIAGCGPRGGYHAQGFIANNQSFDLTACCDIDRAKAEAFAKQYNIPRVYDDADEMLAAEKPDVFCFATLPAVRLSLVELGVKHKVQAIAFEKPIATELSEARKIYDITQKAGIKIVISHQQKYGKHFQKVKEIVDSGEIGDVVKIHATASSWLSQLGTHLMDYMLWFNNRSKVEWVVGQAMGTEMLDDTHPAADFTFGALKFENGVRGIIECGSYAPRFVPGDNPFKSLEFWTDSSITIHGTHGYAQVVTGNGWRAVTKSSGGEVLEGEGMFSPPYEQPLYIKDLADYLDGKNSGHPCDADITYHGFEAVMALYLSALEHRRVTLPLETIPQESLIERLRATLPVDREYEG